MYGKNLTGILSEPWPEIEVVDLPESLASAEAVEGFLEASDKVQGLLKRCRDARERKVIAREFCEKFQAVEPPGSLLLEGVEGTHYWVVGDVHGSLSAIAKVWAYILQEKKKGGRHVLIFLGDVLDRGGEDLETLAFVLSLILENAEGDVLYIAGNHDVGLGWNGDEGVFTSTVRPSETKDRLNTPDEEDCGHKAEGEAAMLLARISPRMIELTGLDPDFTRRTVMLVHGGVPHIDLQKELGQSAEEIKEASKNHQAFLPSIPEEGLRARVAEDYTWLRLSDNLPYKRPNRNTRGCEIGTEDVNAYRRLHYQLTGRAVTCIIRGHDHERAGFRLYSHHEEHNKQTSKGVQKRCHVLTINTMEATAGESGLFRGRRIAFAHLQSGSPLQVIALPSWLPVLSTDNGDSPPHDTLEP